MSDLEMIFPARNLQIIRDFRQKATPRTSWIDRDPKHQGPLASSHWTKNPPELVYYRDISKLTA